MPDDVVIAPEIPRTLTGKHYKYRSSRILGGAPIESVAAPGAVDKPDALRRFEQYGRSRMASRGE